MSHDVYKKLSRREQSRCKSTPAISKKPPRTVSPESSRMEACGKASDSVTILADVKNAFDRCIENAHHQAIHLTETQDEFVRLVRSIKDVVNTAVGITQETRAEPLAARKSLHLIVHDITLLARMIRELKEISNVVAMTIESQGAATRELIKAVSETVKSSSHLAEKVADWAEKAQAIMPALSKRDLVEAELTWLTGELQKVTMEFRGDSKSSGQSDVTRRVAINPLLIN